MNSLDFFNSNYSLNDFINNHSNSNISNEFTNLVLYFDKTDVSFSRDSCNVIMSQNHIIGNLKNYSIRIDPDDFDGIGFEIQLKSIVDPYRPQDGIIKTGNEYFAWLAAVPYGLINGELILEDQKFPISGYGYHDHNWGNTPLQKLFYL